MNRPVEASTMNRSEIAAFLDQQMKEKMEKYNIPNAVVSFVADGEIWVNKGYGYADLQKKKPVDAKRTLFRIGSTSKLLTWTAVMQLVEQGKLDLNTDINQYLDFEIPNRLYDDRSDREAAPITLTHLMSHTPGFEDSLDTVFRISEDNMITLEEYLRDHMPARVFPPGEVMAYSNYGSALAGYIVQRVSGMPFAEYVEQSIYQPLGMTSSTFRQPLPEELVPHMARAYRWIDGQYLEGAFEFLPEPAGGMSSSGADMSAFMLAHLQNKVRSEDSLLLSDATLRQMHSPLFTHHPRLHGMAHGFMEGTFHGQRTLFHSGSTMLFDTGLYLLPDENKGLFISYSGGSYLAHLEIFQSFMERYYPAEEPLPSLPPEEALERSRLYIGEYHQNRKSFTTPESVLSLTMGIIHVDRDDEGYIWVQHVGETNRFVEIEPGVYQNVQAGQSRDYFGGFQTIVFKTDPFGNVMLIADGPMTYSKAPWYASSAFTFTAFGLVLFLILGSFVFWGFLSGIRLIRNKKSVQPKAAIAAKGTAIAFGVLTFGFLLDVVITGEFDPVYGVPKAYYGELTSWTEWAEKIPFVLHFLGAVLLIFSVYIWRKGCWKITGRIHYSMFTLAAMGLLLLFHYWNMV